MRPTDNPWLVWLISFVALSLAVRFGATRKEALQGEIREDFGVVLTAALTLMGLIIGFAFSVAVSRYDQRKNYEEAEANAIGTEYIRADLLPAPATAATRNLLRSYLDQRILFYTTRDAERLRQIATRTAELQKQLWSTVRAPAIEQPSVNLTLGLYGMNDVINSQGYTQAAWADRIPQSAWVLMGVIALLCNAMVGYRTGKSRGLLLWVVPFMLSISFFLIADIDGPRGGIIHVRPENLENLAGSLRGP